MSSISEIENHIIKELNAICKSTSEKFSPSTALVGSTRAIKSVQLVELLLKMEEYVEEKLNKKFDWANNSAMSETRSVLRTINSLAKHIHDLK